MPGQIDPVEFGRRVSAARGYARMSQPTLAEQVGLSASSIKRIEDGQGLDELKREAFEQRAASACGLPREFFTIDFADLTRGNADVDTAVDLVTIDRESQLLIAELKQNYDRLESRFEDLARALLPLTSAEADVDQTLQRERRTESTNAEGEPGPRSLPDQ